MANDEDQPWKVLARRPAPLANLIRSESERKRGGQARGQDDDAEESKEGKSPPADVATSPAPPATVD
jgi:hypothetical protein